MKVVSYPQWRTPWIERPYSPDLSAQREALLNRLSEEADARNEAAKAAALAAAAPEIEAAKAAAEAKEKAETEAKAALLAEKKARRAEIGAVEIDISRGNRDWGTPWGAVVTAHSGRDTYDFDAGTYDLAEELLTIRCQPGDVIAWGQKNFRKPKQTIHERRKITDDWAMVKI